MKGSSFTDKELVALLDVPPHLVGSATKDGGLRLYYAKYQACLRALEAMDNLYREGKWPAARKVTQTAVIELFISKTMWHSHIIKYFKKISEYPDMQLWLEEHDEAPSGLNLWGFEKNSTAYTFIELGAYLVKEDKLRARKIRGNKKGEKGEEKQTETDNENENEKDKGKNKGKGTQGKGKGKGKGKEKGKATDNM